MLIRSSHDLGCPWLIFKLHLRAMHRISPEALNDLPTRIEYLRQFIGFSEDDAAALHAARDVLAPLIPAVADAVYEKLLSFDVTAHSFVPRQTGYTGEAPKDLSELSLDHPVIVYRKDFLKGYLGKIFSMDYDEGESWEYLDKVGLMHTGVSGFKHRSEQTPLRVEYIHCAILLGYVQDILVNAVLSHPELDLETKIDIARAANKLLWIQNDLFARHYVGKEYAPDAENIISMKKPMAMTTALILLAIGAICGRRFLRS